MSNLISTQEAVARIVQGENMKELIVQYSNNGFSAEVVGEIVRCKDCRFNTYSKKCLNPDSFFLVPADDFYCGYAERRTDE